MDIEIGKKVRVKRKGETSKIAHPLLKGLYVETGTDPGQR